MKGRRTKLFVDASPLADDNVTGIPHFTAELVRALLQLSEGKGSIKVILVIAFDKRKKLSKWDYANAQIKTIPLPMRILNWFWKYNLLPPMDIFLGRGTYLFPNYKNWRLMHSQSFTYIHDLGFIRYPEFVQPRNLEFLKANIKKWISRTTIVLTGSDHTRGEIISFLNVSPEKVKRIYHGVDHKEYYPRKQAEISAAKEKYKISGDYMIYVGSLEPRKNLIRLIASYRQLPKKLSDKYALCLVGGGGWLNSGILEAIKHTKLEGFNIIQPSRYVEDRDLPSLLSGATLLVHPALYEGFGLSPLQAMACGTSVLVAHNSSLPEVVDSAGVLVDAESNIDISAKMEKVLTDEQYRQKMVERGLHQAKKFDWEMSAQALIDCIERLANSK